jgi:hypothetical protein
MSLMAGFDLVIEVSSEALLKLIESNATIDGASLVPPFEVNIPLSTGSAHVIVADMQLTLLVGTSKIILTMIFQDSTISLGAVDLPNLSGSFTIDTQLQLVAGQQPNQKVLGVALASAKASVQFDAASQAAITSALPPGATFALFQVAATQSLTTFVQKLGDKSLQPGFNILPGIDGQLSPALRLERLDVVQCIGNDAIALFGILLADRDGQGDASHKESTAITAGHDLCVSVSPEAFTRLQFCPAAAIHFLNITSNPPPAQAPLQLLVLTKMPECCGGAGGVDTDGMKITRFCPTFDTGFINLNGSFDQSGFCYDATGTFDLQMTFQVTGSTLTASISQDHPTVHIDVPWYCWIALFILSAIGFGVVVAGIISAIVAIVLDSLNNFQGTTPGIPPQIMNLSGFPGVALSDAIVTPEGLTLEGKLSSAIPAPRPAQIQITERTITVSRGAVGSGVYHFQGRAFGGSSLCPAEDFPYTEVSQQQTVVCQVIPTLLGTPLKLDISLLVLKSYWGLPQQFSKVLARVKLTGLNGTVTLPVETHFPLPLPNGTKVSAHSAQITYSISGNTIFLSNVPSDGTYSAWLHVEATDPADITAATTVPFGFEGDTVQFGKGYDLHMERCRNSFLESLATLSAIPAAVPRSGDLEQWIADFARYVLNSNLPEKQQILSQLQAQFGAAFQRAIFSSSAFAPRALPAGLAIRSIGPGRPL